MERSECAICRELTTGFNYGVYCCNKCCSFSRRVVSTGRIPTECHYSCHLDQSKVCRSCRYRKCFQVGMSNILGMERSNELTDQHDIYCSLLQDLKIRNESRNKNFVFCCPPDINPSLEEVIDGVESIHFQRKGLNHQMNFEDWVFLCDLSSFQFMKSFSFVSDLQLKDRRILLKNSKLRGCILKHATDAVFNRSSTMSFPDGTGFLPDLITIPHSLDSRIRCRLVSRLIELKITHEEFLLLSMIFFCNPVLTNLSESGRKTIGITQKKYTSALVKYCLNQYQHSGPSRFNDLLSIINIVNETFDNISYFCLLLSLSKNPPNWKKLVLDN